MAQMFHSHHDEMTQMGWTDRSVNGSPQKSIDRSIVLIATSLRDEQLTVEVGTARSEHTRR